MNRRTSMSAAILGGLLALVFVALLISPTTEAGRAHSTHSAGLDGTRLVHDLTRRLGWLPERREVPFTDSATTAAPIQVLVRASVGAAEAQALLRHVRTGGSLLVAGEAGALEDSLPTVTGEFGEPVALPEGDNCRRGSPWENSLSQFGRVAGVGWRRPVPDDTIGFGAITVPAVAGGLPRRVRRAAVGYPLGAGRIVIVADPGFLVNGMIRQCEYQADVSFMRMIEYLSHGERGRRIAFDEYHHGYGVRGGSFTAIRMYLGGTGSGRMLAQMAVAGLLLLFAAAPRPLAPRDPSRIARRSPLEHADALAHAYSSVNATRTATARLLAGVRRRARRDRTRARESDEQLLAAASALSPAAAAAAATVAAALDASVSASELPGVADAMALIETVLTPRSTPPTR